MSVKIKRGVESDRLAYTPLESELLFTTDNKEMFIGDGSTAGGVKISHTPTDILTDLKTVDGSGSGLDSELLGGKNEAAFMQNTNVAGGSANSLITSGAYRIDGSLVDIPNEFDFGQVLVIHSPSDTIAQIAFDYTSDDISWRSGNPWEVGGAGVWGPWRKIFHDGNMGTGSGLDADTLDGYNSTDFFRKNTVNTTSDSIYLDNGTYDTPSVVWQDPTGGGSGTATRLSVDMINESLRFIAHYRGTTTVPLSFSLANNTLSTQHFKTTNDCAIGSTNLPSGLFANGKALAFGDADTGIRQNGDGVLELWANDQNVLHITGTSVNLNKNTTLFGNLTINTDSNNILECSKTGGNTQSNTLLDNSDVGFRFVQSAAVTLKSDNDDFTYQGFNVHSERYGVINIMDHISAAQAAGTADSSASLQSTIDTLVGSQSRTILIPFDCTLRLDLSITLHAGINLIGNDHRNDNGTKGSIIRSHAGVIYLGGSNLVSGLTFIRNGASTTTSALVGYVGKALGAVAGNVVTDVTIRDCSIFGFDLGIDMGNNTTSAQTRGRWMIENINIDCRNGIYGKNLRDTCYFNNIHGWPFLGNGLTTGDLVNGIERGKFIQLGTSTQGADWARLTNCFSHSYSKGFTFQSTHKLTMDGCGVDYERYQSAVAGSYGIQIDGVCRAIGISNCQFSGGELAANISMDGVVNFSSCTFENAKNGLVLCAGTTTFSSCTFEVSASNDVPSPTWAVNCANAILTNNVCLVSNSYINSINSGIAKGANALEVKSYGNFFNGVTTNTGGGVTVV